MKCKVVQRHLLASERPARPPAAVAEHLAHCPACRAWHRQIVRLEHLVPHLPVPASSGKVDCVREVLHSDAYTPSYKPEVGWQRRERALRKVAVTFALAAGLLFFALCWYAWQHQHPAEIAAPKQNRSDVTLETILAHYDPALHATTNPKERVKRLATVAQRLQGEAKDHALAGKLKEVTSLARQFEVLLRDGLLPQARTLADADRPELLDSLADQLARAESEANWLAKEHTDVAKPLQDIAVAAHNGHLELRELAQGKV
jgi:hypothetical protein